MRSVEAPCLLQMLRDKWNTLRPHRDEKTRRLWATPQIRALGRAGLKFVPQANGMSQTTLRRSLSDLQEMTAFSAFVPADTSLETLVAVAGRRWCIECCFEQAKSEGGLDQYEVRSWEGWHRHVTLSMAALAFLSAVRCAEEKKGILFPGKRTGSLERFKQARKR